MKNHTDNSKTTRRQFLQGQSARQALAGLTDASSTTPAPAVEDATNLAADNGQRGYLMQISRRAMACEFQVYLNAGQHAGGPEAALRALDLLEPLEDQMSVYREHSEISRINRTAAETAVKVEPRLFALLAEAVRLHQLTGGAFDVTAGKLSHVWGFYRREGNLPTEEAIRSALEQVGSQWIELDYERSTIRFRRPGIEINLGGIGKGYALDRCAELLGEAGVHDHVIHGGMSSVAARGGRSGSRDAGWSVMLRHPLIPDRKLAEIRLRDCALGTSGSANQFFYHRGRRYGHILDPRSGWAADGVLSATVLAPRAALADSLATALFVMGPEKALEYCRHEQLGALLVCPGQRAGSLEIHTCGLDEDDWTLLA